MDLSTLRDRIDAVDRQIIALLAERLGIVEEVALAKLEAASPFRDREREEHLLLRLREHAARAGLDPHEIERLYRVIMDQRSRLRDLNLLVVTWPAAFNDTPCIAMSTAT